MVLSIYQVETILARLLENSEINSENLITSDDLLFIDKLWNEDINSITV